MARLLLAVAVLVAQLATAGCVAAADPPPRPAPSASTVDVLFLAMMVAHSEQTLEIAELGLTRATDPDLRRLLAAVKVTETDEIATMRGWLRDAGPEAVAAAARHDHSGHSDAVAGLARLRAAGAGEVDRVLAEVLGAHQRTAAGLARAQVAAGTSDRVRELAGRIERSRSAEVALLAKLSAG
ncbi:DUF305 domain-containing protein [Micromonospora mangrovi]|uniref:DUF305 domain-containing protein n=2 Tax=Micromonospora TaxID=1873 RepID=A0AAU8H9G4_9ACTN